MGSAVPGPEPGTDGAEDRGPPGGPPERAPPPGPDLSSTGSVPRHSLQGTQGTGLGPLVLPALRTPDPQSWALGQLSLSPSSLCLPHDRPKNPRDEVLRQERDLLGRRQAEKMAS